MGYYVRVSTRGTAESGTPRQALNYISDGHDARRGPILFRTPSCGTSRGLDPDWKAALEGGRVPLVGFGQLATHADHERLTQEFEKACHPTDCKRGTIGYKSITLTLPKEVSLFAEGHREEAKGAIYAAVQSALDRAFAGLRYSAVAAVHTRNQVGEIHFHVHVLAVKFAQNLNTDRTVSLNSTASRNGPVRVRDMKLGWQEGIEKEFRQRLRLGIEQKTPRSPVSLLMPDGEHLEPLNRDGRSAPEKELCPRYTETMPESHVVIRHFRWSAMDDRIFEIASGGRGESGTQRLVGIFCLRVIPEGKHWLDACVPHAVHLCVNGRTLGPSVVAVRNAVERLRRRVASDSSAGDDANAKLHRDHAPVPRDAVHPWDATTFGHCIKWPKVVCSWTRDFPGVCCL